MNAFGDIDPAMPPPGGTKKPTDVPDVEIARGSRRGSW
jgi:hypothetical protein